MSAAMLSRSTSSGACSCWAREVRTSRTRVVHLLETLGLGAIRVAVLVRVEARHFGDRRAGGRADESDDSNDILGSDGDSLLSSDEDDDKVYSLLLSLLK